MIIKKAKVRHLEQLMERFGTSAVYITTAGDLNIDDALYEAHTNEIHKILELPEADKPALLGRQVVLPQRPEDAVIDTVPNKNYGDLFIARFSAPEFTSMCPVTGQPDFARIYIDYIPGPRMVESKALKLFLGSFRNHGAFHEECTMMIKNRLIEALCDAGNAGGPGGCSPPAWFRIAAYWYPRGGIPIDVFWQSGEPPTGVLIPDLPKFDFTGR